MASSPYSGFIADPAKCRSLSVNEKRELVRELSKCPGSALELLNEWTRRDIVQILCSDLRKERKYNGVSKQSILNYLFKAVNGKSSSPGKCVKEPSSEPNSSNVRFPYKRQRKNDVPPFAVIASIPVTAGVTAPTNNAHLCQNSACRASLNPADKFCRRCSCCICFKYDDNKDPSLWLFCNSDQPLQEESCGLSCHLECAFKDERSGIPQRGLSKKLDGDYYCIHCGKQNDLLWCWKKQLLIAKDARRLDVLCHRVFLSHKILISTEKYLALHEIVDTAMKKLEGEVGPITGIRDMGRGIVGRLAVGAEVQKLCTCAIETLESMFSGALTADLQIQRSCMVPSNFIKFEDISPGSVTVVFDLDVCPTLSQGLTGFNLWHRKAIVEEYPSNPTGIIPMPSTMLVVRGLAPCTYYVIKVVAFTNSKEIGSWEVRTKTICCPKEEDAKNSMPADAGTDPNNRSPKANSSGLSNSSSEGVESDNDSTIYADLSKSPESDAEYCKNIDILYSDRASHHCNETASNSQDLKMGDVGVAKVVELDESPRISASALDDEEETGSAALAALLRKSLELTVDSRGTLKQNLAMIGEIASHAHTGNKSVAPPEYSRSLLPIIQIETENWKGVSGRSFEAKSGDHSPQDDSLKAETGPGSLSCQRTSGRIDDSGHKDGPSEPNTTSQISSFRESSNLVLDKQGILLQNLSKDAARLENASGSLVPITENVIKFGNGVSGISSKSKTDDYVSQPGPSKPETVGSSSNKKSPGKSEDINRKDAHTGSSYEYCVKVIRWLECEGYIEANFRAKFLTWFSLRASPHERRIVSVFLDTLIDDPVSLAGQLSDTFSDAIYSKRPRQAPSGFCMEFWH